LILSISLYHPDIHYWLAAVQVPRIGPVSLRKWVTKLGNIKNIFSLSEQELYHNGLTKEQVHAVRYPNWDMIERILLGCEKEAYQLLTWDDPLYPPLLLETAAAPAVLFIQGNGALLSAPQIALVGSRHPSFDGRKTAERFAEALAMRGWVITSGLALGIDSASHHGALQASGKTIAVLGSGLNHIYPHSNRPLAERIKQHGALVSEFWPHDRPKAHHFPQRNRIISGLSQGVLVIEAATQSGSLITARMAGEQGREVFAIPGSIYSPKAKGCHQLIRQGAKLVETIEDIVEELAPLRTVYSTKITQAPVLSEAKLEANSQKLLTKIGYEVTPLDAILLGSELTAGEVSSMLLQLELGGYVRTVAGGYQRK
jgi:DNA processing protein